MKIETRTVIDASLLRIYLYITISNRTLFPWHSQLAQLKSTIRQGYPQGYTTVYSFSFEDDLQKRRLDQLALLVKKATVALNLTDPNANSVITFQRRLAFVKRLLPDTIGLLTSDCSFSRAQAIIGILPGGTALSIDVHQRATQGSGLSLADLHNLLLPLPKDVTLLIAPGCSDVTLAYFLRALPQNRKVELPAQLTLAQCQQVGKYISRYAMIQLHSDITAPKATAVAQHLVVEASLFIKSGRASPCVYKALAKHIRPPAAIKLHPTVNVVEALLIARHLTHPDVFEVNPSVPATVDPSVTAAIHECRIKALLRTAQRQNPNTIDLPADISGCTIDILNMAFRKFQGRMQLHVDTSIAFGTMVAQALPHSMALMLPSYDIHSRMPPLIRAETIYAIVSALKPGKKLYAETLTTELYAAIWVLQRGVTLLLNIETMSQQDAIAIIKRLPPGCILGLVATKEQLSSEAMQATYQHCISQLPKGCFLKITADMEPSFILSLKPYLPECTTFLMPKALTGVSDAVIGTQLSGIESPAKRQRTIESTLQLHQEPLLLSNPFHDLPENPSSSSSSSYPSGPLFGYAPYANLEGPQLDHPPISNAFESCSPLSPSFGDSQHSVLFSFEPRHDAMVGSEAADWERANGSTLTPPSPNLYPTSGREK